MEGIRIRLDLADFLSGRRQPLKNDIISRPSTRASDPEFFEESGSAIRISDPNPERIQN